MTKFHLSLRARRRNASHMRNHLRSMDSPIHIRHRGGDVVWTATGHERPIFLDERGTRRRWVLLGGALTGSLSALWLAALIAGAIGFSSLPSLNGRRHLLAQRAGLAPASVDRVYVAQSSHRRRRRAPSELDRATGLAVSRGVLSIP